MIVKEMERILNSLNNDLGMTYHENFQLIKKETIDAAFQMFPIKKVAELGCVWKIDGAYGLYMQEKYRLQKMYMVDTDWTEAALEKCDLHEEIEVIKGNFGTTEIRNRIGNVDAVVFFDILPHQVAPDWDMLLSLYAGHTKVFIIVEPFYIGGPITVRLLDLGKEMYFKNVPHNESHPTYKSLFEKMYDMHPDQKRIWRDIHNVWQWGITRNDLIMTLEKLGFSLEYLKNWGQFGHLENFQYNAMVFSRGMWS